LNIGVISGVDILKIYYLTLDSGRFIND